MMEKYMKIALKEAKKSYLKGDVPVGAIIVENGKIIAKAHNEKERKRNAIKHAEILAISQACRKKKSWHLDGCEMYVTVEPCLMCSGALIQSRIKTLIYATKNEKFGYVDSIEPILNNKKNNHKIKIISGICCEESQELMKNFFKEKRR